MSVARAESPEVSRAGAVTGGAGAPRIAFIDNLRWSMILLVVSMHAADTYSPFGNWYYGDKAATGRMAAMAFGTYQVFLQAFFMSLLFAVSGYFARASLLRKGRALFLRDRFLRLGVPVVLYMLLIGPVTQFYVAHSWHPPGGTPFWAEWWRHIVDGEVFSESGPLWFCVALLGFCLVYAGIGAARPARIDGKAGKPPSFVALLGFIAALAAATFAIRLAIPEGRAILNLELGDFGQYVLMFAAGIAAHRGGWVARWPSAAGRYWLAAGVVLGLAGWVLIVALGGALDGRFDAYAGGWHWPAAAKALWESFVCVALSLGLLTVYRDRLNVSNPLFAFLSANAFAVYVFHPPILIAVTRLISHWPAPVGSKFLAAWALAIVGSYLFAALVARRMPALRAVL